MQIQNRKFHILFKSLMHSALDNIPLYSILFFLMLVTSGCKKMEESDKKKKADALLTQLKQTSVDTTGYLQLVDSLYNIAAQINYESGIAKAFSFNGDYLASKSNYEEAIKKYREAIKISQQSGDLYQLGNDFNNLGRMYFRLKKRVESIAAFKDAVKSRNESQDSTGLGSSLNNIGFMYWQISDYDSAVIYFEQALKIRNKLSNIEFRATTYNNLGTVFFNWTLYDKALDYYLHAFELQSEIGNSNGIALSLCNIGLVYQETTQHEKAIEYYREALSHAFASKQLQTTGYVYSCLGAAFRTISRDSSLYYFKKSLDSYKSGNNNDGEILALQGIGEYYLNVNELTTAKIYFTQMLNLALKENIAMRLAQAYNYLGKISLAENDLTGSKKSFEKSIEISKKSTLKLILKDSFLSLSEVYERTGKSDSALSALKEHNNYKFQIENEGMQKRLLDLKNKSEYEKYQRNLQAQKYENERQNIYLNITIIAVLFLFIIAVILSRLSIKRKNINLLLHNKNILIEEQSNEINLKNEELLELNEAKEKLFSIIAHDLRSPFNTLINFGKLLKEEHNNLTDAENLEYISYLEETSLKTYELVENLLNLSASHTGRIDFSPARIELYELVEKIISLSNSQAVKKDIILKNNVDKVAKAFADRSMLEIIIRNLVNNAIKYCNPGGEVEVMANYDEDKVLISVIDNGIGMDEETKENIFNVNVIQSKRGTSGEKGTGLGLGLCKEFVEKHGGQLWLESEIGKGSKFVFSLSPEDGVSLNNLEEKVN